MKVRPDAASGLEAAGTFEDLTAAAALLREHRPNLRVRVVNVVDLMRLQPDAEHPLPSPGTRAAGLRQAMVDERLRHRAYTREVGEDMPDVWEWARPSGGGAQPGPAAPAGPGRVA